MSMRSTDEFLREFAIVMTDKGVVSITDPLHLAIYRLLCERSMRPSEITEALSIPSSSLHFILDKMVDAGIIVRSKPDPSKKEVQYSIIALKIAASEEPTPEAIARSKRVFSDPEGGYTGLAAVSNMLEAYTDEIGLDLSELRARYVKDLSARFRDEVGKGTMESKMDAIVSRINALTGYRTSIYSLNPLTAVFEGDDAMRSKMDMLSLLLADMVEDATSRHQSVRSIEDFSNGGSVRYKVVFERTEPEDIPYVNTTLPRVAEPERFLVMDIDGRAVLLMNDIQTRLVDAVYERPLCVSDIVDSLGMPRSTVTTNLLRMVEEGVVSVFYAESGAVYYGLSCAILMKRCRRVSRDQGPTRGAIKAAAVDGGFVGGYLQYLLASLQELGFDTDYMMVVLGARYMRAAGADGPKNFDFYFGKMSDIARVLGLSLGVASVYPLTIGISREGGEGTMAPAMTFVKGMAHQGLEMASSGIFVRNSEDSPDDVRVSFKEIYPTLSMSSSSAEAAVADAAAETSKKKRSSSLRDALVIRKSRSDGRPTRTVRYITAGVFAVVLAALLVFSGGVGTDNTASGETYEFSVDTLAISVYDSTGAAINTPCLVDGSEPFVFSVSCSFEVGVVSDGIAYPLSEICTVLDENTYSIEPAFDMVLTQVREVQEAPEGLEMRLYDFGRTVSAGYAASYEGYYSVSDYADAAGGLWLSDDAVVLVQASEGGYVGIGDDTGIYLTRIVCDAWGMPSVTSEALPDGCSVVTLQDAAFEVSGYYVSGSLMVETGRQVSMDFVGTDGPVKLTLVTDGVEEQIFAGQVRNPVSFTVSGDCVLVCVHTDFC